MINPQTHSLIVPMIFASHPQALIHNSLFKTLQHPYNSKPICARSLARYTAAINPADDFLTTEINPLEANKELTARARSPRRGEDITVNLSADDSSSIRYKSQRRAARSPLTPGWLPAASLSPSRRDVCTKRRFDEMGIRRFIFVDHMRGYFDSASKRIRAYKREKERESEFRSQDRK